MVFFKKKKFFFAVSAFPGLLGYCIGSLSDNCFQITFTTDANPEDLSMPPPALAMVASVQHQQHKTRPPNESSSRLWNNKATGQGNLSSRALKIGVDPAPARIVFEKKTRAGLR